MGTYIRKITSKCLDGYVLIFIGYLYSMGTIPENTYVTYLYKLVCCHIEDFYIMLHSGHLVQRLCFTPMSIIIFHPFNYLKDTINCGN